MELFDLASCRRDLLPDFLRTQGTFAHLKRMVFDVEEADRLRYGYPKHIFKIYAESMDNPEIILDYMRRRNASAKDISPIAASNELPTTELCRVLAALITHAGSASLREVGAGSGLLSRMLSFSLDIPIAATDKNAPDSPGQTFVPVRAESFEETVLAPGEDVAISWLHVSVEDFFLEMVEKCRPANVWHVGQLAGGECFSGAFVARMAAMGYGFLRVAAKQFSHIDYFLEEREVADGMSRTAIGWFSRRPFPDIAELCRPEDLGVYRELTSDYVGQFVGENYPEMPSDAHIIGG